MNCTIEKKDDEKRIKLVKESAEQKKYSVLMSLYKKENPEYLRIAIDSMLNQTVAPDEIVLVEDGPLTDELYAVLDDYPMLHRKKNEIFVNQFVCFNGKTQFFIIFFKLYIFLKLNLLFYMCAFFEVILEF